MFLLYHSEGCKICKSVLCECYVNNLYTTTCSGVLGHRRDTFVDTISASTRSSPTVMVAVFIDLEDDD
jgi:hypothetical protein